MTNDDGDNDDISNARHTTRMRFGFACERKVAKQDEKIKYPDGAG